jgi:hypothetical protein
MTQKFTRIIRTLGRIISGAFFDADLCRDKDVELGIATGFDFGTGPVHRSSRPPGPGPDGWTGSVSC